MGSPTTIAKHQTSRSTAGYLLFMVYQMGDITFGPDSRQVRRGKTASRITSVRIMGLRTGLAFPPWKWNMTPLLY